MLSSKRFSVRTEDPHRNVVTFVTKRYGPIADKAVFAEGHLDDARRVNRRVDHTIESIGGDFPFELTRVRDRASPGHASPADATV